MKKEIDMLLIELEWAKQRQDIHAYAEIKNLIRIKQHEKEQRS